ncbi:hypothetical protein Tco_1242119 [Tanacetum coccineum]
MNRCLPLPKLEEELEDDVVTLLKRIRKFSMTQDIGTRAAVHIFSRIGFAVAKENLEDSANYTGSEGHEVV